MYIKQQVKNLREFGIKLTKYREANNFSRFEFADLVNVSREHIWRLENGFRGCSRDLVILIAHTLHLEIEQLNDLLLLAGHRPILKKGRIIREL